MIEPKKIETLVEFYSALADTTRLKMVGLLTLRPMRGQDLAAELGVSAPTISHHMGKLKKLNLVRALREEDGVYFSLDTERLQELNKSILAGDESADVKPKAKRNEREKVLATFFQSGRLKDIPVQHKKKLYILEEILQSFVTDKEYGESEVNEIIKSFFDDFCTLRREFINNGYMSRKAGMYWVNPQEDWINHIIRDTE